MNVHILSQWQSTFIFAVARLGSGLGALPCETGEHVA